MNTFFSRLKYNPKRNERILLIIFTLILTVSFLFTYFTQNQGKSRASGEGVMLSFDPNLKSTASGEAFLVSINATPSAQISIEKYRFDVKFDPSSTEVTDIAYKIGSVSAGLGDDNSKLSVVNSAGVIKLQGETASTEGKIISPTLSTQVAVIAFKSKSTQQNSITVDTTTGEFLKQNANDSPTSVPIALFSDLIINGPTPFTLHIKLKFQGLTKKPRDDLNHLAVKVTSLSSSGEKSESNISLRADDSGIWSGSPSLSVKPGSNYTFFIKGESHLQKKICDQKPTETVAGKYSCTTGAIVLTATDQELDFSGIYVLAGDLPVQDGIINSYDISLVRNNLGKNQPDILSKADINKDGVVDSQDYSLVIAALGIQREDEVIPSITPTPTGTVTSTPTLTPLPSSQLTPSPTMSAGGFNDPYVLGPGYKWSNVEVDSAGKAHYVWGDAGEDDVSDIWYTKCGSSVSSCSTKQKLNAEDDYDAYYPSVALDTQGHPHVVWEEQLGATYYQLFYSHFDGSVWTTPNQIHTSNTSELPDLAIDSTGKLHLVYESKQNNGIIYYTESSNNGTSWATSQVIGDGLFPQVSLNSSNFAYIAWNARSPDHGVFYKYQTSQGWSSNVTVSTGHDDQAPDIAINSQGEVDIVWSKSDAQQISYAHFVNDTRTSLTDNLGGGLTHSLWSALAVDSNSNVHVVFQGESNGIWGIYYRKKTGTLFGNVVTIKTKNNESVQTPGISIKNGIGALIYYDDTNEWGQTFTL